jgi:RNA polymerase sigma-70 factor (ECF subfamily)
VTVQVAQNPRELGLGDAEASQVPVVPTTSLSDTELVRRACASDSWAEEAIYRRYAAMILGMSKRLLADKAEAEDVTQDTFARAFQSLTQLRQPDRLRQWLMQIAVSKVHRRFRRRKVLRALGLQDSPNDATLELLASTNCSQETRAELALLAKALDRLSASERIAWMLRHVEGLPLEEVAQECECSLATVKRRIAAAAARIERFTTRGSA